MTLMYIRPFEVKAEATPITVTGTTANTAIGRSGVGTQSVRLANVGTQVVFFNLGKSSAVTATTSNTPLLPNTTETFTLLNDITHIAAIAATTGSTLYVTTGESA